MDNKVNIVYKNIDELIPYINNPRNNENAIDAVASSIKNFGFKQPIVIDSKNEVVAGHTRLLASKKLGLEEVPVIIASDLSDAKIRAFRLADNKVAELSEWDYNVLGLELEEIPLDDLDFDMSDFGFEEASIDEFDEDFELENNDEPLYKTMNFTFSNSQYAIIDSALDSIDLEDSDIVDNTNKNGNKLYKLVTEWTEAQKI